MTVPVCMLTQHSTFQIEPSLHTLVIGLSVHGILTSHFSASIDYVVVLSE